jgi:gliding motility-associated lipoprotein GldB
MRAFLLVLIVFASFLSCEKESSNLVDTSNIKVDFSVSRFDVDFYTSSATNLSEIKEKYPLLFPVETPDSVWIQKINDKDELELFSETQKIYENFSEVEQDLRSFFTYVKYYNKGFETPNVITVLSNIDYENRIIYSDSLLFLSLDVYLGKEHPFYADYPGYIKHNNTKAHIAVDVANKLIEKQFPLNKDRTFISKIIHEGKKAFARDLYLPLTLSSEKLGYTVDKLNWVVENEVQIWKYFIGNDLLYSTDPELNKRFLDKAPFSKFYLREDSLSPGEVGVWIGLQIVHSYMRSNDVSLQELMSKNTSEVFKNSKYKPRK